MERLRLTVPLCEDCALLGSRLPKIKIPIGKNEKLRYFENRQWKTKIFFIGYFFVIKCREKRDCDALKKSALFCVGFRWISGYWPGVVPGLGLRVLWS